MKTLKNKRGMTLLETVVALALLAIISVVSISVSVMSIKSEEKNIQATEIAIICENAVECFRFDSDPNKFKDLFEKTGENLSKGEKSDNVFTIEKSSYSVTITIVEQKISIVATGKNGAEIYSLEYVRAL